jgi:hypothetical protein
LLEAHRKQKNKGRIMKMKTVFEKDTWKVLEREDGKFLVRLTTEEAKIYRKEIAIS